MAPHQIEFVSSAAKDYRGLPKALKPRIARALEALAEDPLVGKPLQGPFQGLRSLRVGEYRIVYKQDRARLALVVYRLGHRRDIYR